ncbi:hypothetical protein PINS_up013712 [Pythium insidiosum]|nr:hypothetical protein PINS_up013712 [Pythium insidiosum]
MENLHGDVPADLMAHQMHHGLYADDGAPPAGDAGADYAGPIKLFVGQVPRTMEEMDLRPVLEVYGPLEDIVIIRDKLTGAHARLRVRLLLLAHRRREGHRGAPQQGHAPQRTSPLSLSRVSAG